eukprot:4164247-Prymnesium_polylepis.1
MWRRRPGGAPSACATRCSEAHAPHATHTYLIRNDSGRLVYVALSVTRNTLRGPIHFNNCTGTTFAS